MWKQIIGTDVRVLSGSEYFYNKRNVLKQKWRKVMYLEKIKSEDLLFTNEIEDNRINTYLNLADYDGMNYTLTTRFKTEKMGVLNVKFEYFGMVTSTIEVTKTLNNMTEKVIYEYPIEIFKRHIVKFLEKHISSWDSKYAFDGEEDVIEFFNEVLDKGSVIIWKIL